MAGQYVIEQDSLSLRLRKPVPASPRPQFQSIPHYISVISCLCRHRLSESHCEYFLLLRWLQLLFTFGTLTRCPHICEAAPEGGGPNPVAVADMSLRNRRIL